MPEELVTAAGLLPTRQELNERLEAANLYVQGLQALKFRLEEIFRQPDRINAMIGSDAATGAHSEKRHVGGWRTRVRFVDRTTPVLELEAPAGNSAAMLSIRLGSPNQPAGVPDNVVRIPLIP